jgi:hypothetical protein
MVPRSAASTVRDRELTRMRKALVDTTHHLIK